MEQYKLCPLLPHREKVFALLFPHPVYMPHPISKWPARPLSHSLYPDYTSGLRTPVQHLFSLELAHCSNSISHSNKLYFPLILSHVWKYQPAPRPEQSVQSSASSLNCSASSVWEFLSEHEPIYNQALPWLGVGWGAHSLPASVSGASVCSCLKQDFSSQPETEVRLWQWEYGFLATRPVANDKALACQLCTSEFPHRGRNK